MLEYKKNEDKREAIADEVQADEQADQETSNS